MENSNHRSYFKQVLRSEQQQQLVIVTYLLLIVHGLTMPLKVFVRSHFGKNYFTFLGTCVLLAVIAYLPLHFNGFWRFTKHFDFSKFDWDNFFLHYASTYALLWVCVKRTLKRKKEIGYEAGVLDFNHYSMASGDIWEWFFRFKINGKPVDVRHVETLIEPLFFFLIGLALIIFRQYVGFYIAAASLMQWWAQRVQYHAGDQFFMLQVDISIVRAALARIFLDGPDRHGIKGFKFYGPREMDDETKEKLGGILFDENEAVEVN